MTRTARIEGRVQIGIMLLMGGGAGAASFKHIHDLALAYGQPSWIGWANAVVVELMSIVAGLEIRRRKRTGQSAGFVYLVFFGAVLISLAANVAKAHPSPWGWIMAALPALGFLAVVKIVLTRQPTETEPVRSDADSTGPVQPPIQRPVRTPGLDTQTPPAPGTPHACERYGQRPSSNRTRRCPSNVRPTPSVSSLRWGPRIIRGRRHDRRRTRHRAVRSVTGQPATGTRHPGLRRTMSCCGWGRRSRRG